VTRQNYIDVIRPSIGDAQGGKAPVDWLDSCCWRCGADDFLPDAGGGLLCRPCLDQTSALEDDVTDPVAVSRGAYWTSHALERCWRCMAEAVDPQGDVGLCPDCRGHLERPLAGSG
jgi:hypothetical protein